MCIFEYDEKRETELIRKAEFAEGEKVGEAKILLNLIEKGILTKEQALEQFGGTYEDLEKSSFIRNTGLKFSPKFKKKPLTDPYSDARISKCAAQRG